MPDLTPDRSLRRPPPPGAREAVTATGRRRRAAALSGGALGLAVLVAVPVALALQPGGADRLVGRASPAAPVESPAAASPAPAAPCPATLPTSRAEQGRSVPAPAPEELAGALAPDEPPLAVSICRYGDAQGTGFPAEPPDEVALLEERSLEAGLGGMPEDLAVPAGTETGPCQLAGGPVIPHLVQLRYSSGVVWLRTHEDPNHCALITNGRFTSGVYLGGQVAASFDARAWVPPPPPRRGLPESACPREPAGRAGQERALVPPGWDRLVVCRGQGSGQTASEVDEPTATAITSLLGELTASPTAGYSAGCDGGPTIEGDDETQYFLAFHYPTGRDVWVIPFFGCSPAVSNGSLAAEASKEQQEELLRLLQGD